MNKLLVILIISVLLICSIASAGLITQGSSNTNISGTISGTVSGRYCKSFNNRTGAVVSTTGDYTALQVGAHSQPAFTLYSTRTGAGFRSYSSSMHSLRTSTVGLSASTFNSYTSGQNNASRRYNGRLDWSHVLNAPIVNGSGAISIADYGAIGDGSFNNYSAFKKAFNAYSSTGVKVFVPPAQTGKYYKVKYYPGQDPIYVGNGHNPHANFIMEGSGAASELRFDGYSTVRHPVFKVFVNATDDSMNGSSTPCWGVGLSVDNLNMDASGSPGGCMIIKTAAPIWLRRINTFAAKWLVQTIVGSYVDQSRLEAINWFYDVPGGWLYQQQGNGDSLYASNIEITGESGGNAYGSGLYLLNNNGSILHNINGGHYLFEKCKNLTVDGMHSEVRGSDAITIKQSSVLVRNSFFWVTNHCINIDDTDTDVGGSIVNIEKNGFYYVADDVAYAHGAGDIYLTSFKTGSSLTLKENFGRLIAGAYRSTGFNTWPGAAESPVTVAASDSDINSVLSLYSDHMMGTGTLAYQNGAWAWSDTGPASAGVFVTRSATDPVLQVSGISSSGLGYPIPSTHNNDGVTYYYRVVTSTLGTRVSLPSAEISISSAAVLRVTVPVYPCKLIVYRGTSPGTYNYNVTIPVNAGYVDLYDQGNSLSGIWWSAGAGPALPALNNTVDGVLIKGWSAIKAGVAPSTFFNVAANGDICLIKAPAAGIPMAWIYQNSIATWIPVGCNPVAGANVASASTITPTGVVFHVTGTTTINTINLQYTGFIGSITIIPDDVFSTGTSGNIALASTSVVNRALTMTYDTSTSKWIPSY